MKLRIKGTDILNCSYSKVLLPKQDLHKISLLMPPKTQKKPLQMYLLAEKKLQLSIKHLQTAMV